MDVLEQHSDVVKQLEALADRYRQDMSDDLTKVEGTGQRPAGVCTSCKTNFRKP